MSVSATEAGKSLRMRRIFRGPRRRAVVLAADHGILGSFAGLERLAERVGQLAAAAPDALLLNAQAARRCLGSWDPARTGLVLACDAFVRSSLPFQGGGPQDGEDHQVLAEPADVLALGGDMLKAVLVFGQRETELYGSNLKRAARLIRRADSLGLPTMLEATLWGARLGEGVEPTAEMVGHMARIGMELGADCLKLPFVSDPSAYRQLVVDRVPGLPVLALGGSRRDSPEAVLELAQNALAAGCAGVVFGRNVWQQPHAAELLAELQRLVHGPAGEAPAGAAG